MKRFLLKIMFLLIMLPTFSQVYVEIQGHIDDSATGDPIPFKEYTIVSDSSSGFIYNYTGQSDPTGFIFHLVPVPSGSSGILYFQTLDCNQILRGDTLTFNPANLDFWVAFDICYADTGCQAYFYTYAWPNREFIFHDGSSGYPTNWYWNFGDGTTSTDQDTWHQYSANGWYTVTLTINDTSSGCQSSISNDVYANDSSAGNCQANFIATFDSTNNPPFTYQFHDLSTGSLNTWVWDFGDGYDTTIVYPGNPNISHSYSQPGYYTACLYIQGIDSTCYDTTCEMIAVGPSIGCFANFTYSSSPNTSTPTQFEDLSQITGGGTISSWGWSFGDPGSGTNNFSNLQNPAHLFSSAGSFTVCLTIQGTDSTCFDSICKIIIVGSNAGCTANFTYSSNPNTSTPTQFTDLSTSTGGGPITLWSWVFDDYASGSSNTSDLQNPTHLFAAPGYHNVSLFIAREDLSCTDIIYKTVFVESLVPVYLTINGTVTNTTTGEPGPNHAVTWGILDDTTTGPHTVYTNSNGFYSDSLQLPPGMLYGNRYLWTDYCDFVEWMSTDFGPDHYDLHWDINHSCDSNQMCNAKMAFSAAGPLTVQFEDMSTGYPTLWAWDFGDGTTSVLQNPVHTYSSPGDYLATLTITNEATGCSSTTSKLIHFADSALCHASFSYSDTINPRTIQFNDLSTGGSGIRFWDFGDGEKSTMANPLHTYRHPGWYRVFLNISNNDSSCWDATSRAILVDDSVPDCQAQYTFIPGSQGNENTIQFQDQSTGYPEFWFWSFGDSTYSASRNPVHDYPGPGTYNACLTISGNGCTSAYCSDVIIEEDTVVYHQVYGQVFEGYFPLQAGNAMIFSLDSGMNYNPYVDVSPIDTNGVYYFTLVPDGNYVIYAIPLDSGGYFPTYFGNAVNWTEATVIPLGEPENPYDIHLLQSANMPTGPGSVTGQINLPGIKSSLISKVIMLLMNENGNVISFEMVSESGSFDFPTLDYGTYFIYAELPGTTGENIKVVLTPENPHADVVLTFSGKNILGIESRNPLVEAGAIYPNPTDDLFNLVLKLAEPAELKIEIFNQSGQIVSRDIKSIGQGNSILKLSASGLKPGFYTLRVTSEQGINIIRKLLIAK